MSTNSDSKSPNFIGKTSNLKRHLQRFHPKIYELVIKKDSTIATSAKSQKSYIAKKVVPLTNFFESRKVTVNMTSSKFKNCIIEMVVRNSILISFFSKPAFIIIDGKLAEKLLVPLHRDSIRNIVIKEATRQKQELKNPLKNCFLFLKMDGCTRHRVNYFAINARFTNDDNKIVTKTLSIKDTHANHTSGYLSKLVETVLQDFKINKQQVLCIVTENAANRLSSVEKLNLATVDEEDIHEVDSNYK